MLENCEIGSMSKKYYIVEFYEDDPKTVEVVPNGWIKEISKDSGTCAWPDKNASFLAKSCTLPNKSWDSYQVRIIASAGTYDEGRKKLLRAEETSDLSSEMDLGKHKRRKRIRDWESESDSDDVHCNNNHESFDEPPTPPPLSRTPIIKNVQKRCHTGNSGASSSSDNGIIIDSVTSKKDKESCHLASTSSSTKVISSRDSTTITSHSSTANKYGGSVYEVLGSGEVNSKKNEQIINVDKDWMKRIERQVTYLKVGQRQMMETLDVIINKIDQSDSVLDMDIVHPFDELPLDNEESLLRFEETLTNPSIKTKLIQHYRRLGGKSVDEATKNILRATFTNNLASRCNWMGIGNKKTKISGLELTNAMISAVMLLKTDDLVTQSNIESLIKRWLQHARDRIISKEKCTNKKVTNTIP